MLLNPCDLCAVKVYVNPNDMSGLVSVGGSTMT